MSVGSCDKIILMTVSSGFGYVYPNVQIAKVISTINISGSAEATRRHKRASSRLDPSYKSAVHGSETFPLEYNSPDV